MMTDEFEDDPELEQMKADLAVVMLQRAQMTEPVRMTDGYEADLHIDDPFFERFNRECVLTAKIARLFQCLGPVHVTEEHEVDVGRACRLYHEIWAQNKEFGGNLSKRRSKEWCLMSAYNCLKGGDISRACETMRGFARRGLEIVCRLAEARRELENMLDDSETVKAQIQSELSKASVPVPAEQRQYHLHYSQANGGGGDVAHVMERLRADPNVKLIMGGLWCPYYEFKMIELRRDSGQLEFYGIYCIDFLHTCHMHERSIMEYGLHVCLDSARVELVLERYCRDVADMVDELTLWKALSVAMGVHPRLGNKSLLAGLSPELVRMIVDFV